MLQLSDVQADKGVQSVAGFCPTSDELIELVDASTRRLMRRGDWFVTAIPIYVCVFNGCICWPRYVGQVRRLHMCNSQIPVRNLWYQFMVGVGAGGCGTW